ncbi:MAG: hypothetical protein ACOY0T_29800 [Myxococcota bacterium]
MSEGPAALLARGALPGLRFLSTPRARRIAFEAAFALGALTSAWPLFVARYVPIQDLPQHVAAVRVLHDFRTAAFGFERFFELSLGSTQYLGVYVLAHLLAYVFDVVVATKLVLAASLVSLPYALRALLSAHQRPASYALLSLPLLYNTQVVLGFLNFSLGLPLMFWGLALASRFRALPERRLGGLFALVATACFFAHVVPYGMLLVGSAALAVSRDVRLTLRTLLPLLPSLGCALIWTATSPAGQAFSALSAGGALLAAGEPMVERARDVPFWLTDVLWSDEDELVLAGFGLLLSALAAAALLRRQRPQGLWLRLGVLAPCCWFFYFLLPASYQFIWPINARFAVLALLFLIPILPRVAEPLRALVALGALGLGLFQTRALATAFEACSQREYAGLGEVVQRVPVGSRVVGLVYDPSSRWLRFSPYLHAVAWVQAERGGAVMFTFADFPASPFRFREDNRPPRVPPRWEWLPHRVDTERDLGFYDYVLARSAPSVAGFHVLERRGAWSLWSR